ncbi:hypothetical protein [Candidatus Williamhamiltonella defendens]|nr:hypothetical protein [Candidatus Hamiltonella defensa]
METVPTGIDPGWNYHPGKARLSHTQTFGKEKYMEFSSIVGTIR